MVTKCKGIQKSGPGVRGHKEGWRWENFFESSGGWDLPLQVDNLYTGGWVGELRGMRGKGERVKQRKREGTRGQREFYRYSGEGEAWLKESTPMETNKILF